ncbi:MAG: DUF1016 N-terminal domain-containing protein [Clostridium sp.]|nr:DUF1016 N-terminal domain-containing protein [Clostridium sp.]
MKLLNAETINLYWEIGEEIHHQQDENAWGSPLFKCCQKNCQRNFRGAKGYSADNLWRQCEIFT